VTNSIRDSASVQVVLLLVVSAALIAAAIYILYRMRRNPRDKEKRRRMAVNLHGRLSEAIITEVQDNTVYYSYSISGVVYTASQDISQLRELIQTDPERLIGNVSLKYQPRNPANSIILCEDWSGLRVSRT
jgi:hypothetical protein